MTLHEAIKTLLLDHHDGLTVSRIADLINQKKIYTRRDNLPVSQSQISARVRNYGKLFLRTGNTVTLRGFDEIALKEEKINTELFELVDILQGRHMFRNLDLLELLLSSLIELDRRPHINSTVPEFFERIKARAEVGRGFDLMLENVTHPFLDLIISIHRFPNRPRIVQRLTHWLTAKEAKLGNMTILPEYLSSIIGHLDIYSPNTYLTSTPNMLNNARLSILEKHPDFNFQQFYFELWKDSRIMRVNSLLHQCVLAKTIPDERSIQTSDVAVITPPWNVRNKHHNWSSSYMYLEDQYSSSNQPKLDRAVLVVPEGALFNGGKDLKAREMITNNRHIEAIITLPFRSKFTTIKSVCIILFNFQRNNDQVFMADLHQLENLDVENEWLKMSAIINEKRIINDISDFVYTDELIHNRYNWSPKQYLQKPIDFEVKEAHKVYRLKDLLRGSRRGKNVERASLHEGGEIKYIRTRDLSQHEIFLRVDEEIPGIDHDELDRPVFRAFNSVLVSLIGNHIKSTLIPDDRMFLFDHHLAVLEADENIVLAEYLAHEMREEYVAQQVNYLRKGVTIPTISLKRILDVEIQVPSLEKQKDILLAKNKSSFHIDHFKPKGKQKDTSTLQNYLGVIKHTMKQPLATLTEDVKSIQRYLAQKAKEGKIDMSEFIVPLLPGEDPDQNTEGRIENTLERSRRALADLHWRLAQSEVLLTIETADIKLKTESIKQVITEQMRTYTDIKTEVVGDSAEVQLDKNLWRILMDNLIDNARKHGFGEQENKRVRFELEVFSGFDGGKDIVISYMNNGEPLPEDFNVQKFVSNGETSNKEVGDGFGGYLINNILKKHKGSMEVVPSHEMKKEKYNVCFKIYLTAL